MMPKAYGRVKNMRQGIFDLEIDGMQTGKREGRVFLYGNYLILRSYMTVVAVINTKTHKFYIRDYYSMTTTRHINKFLADNSFNPVYKKDYSKYRYPYSWDRFINIIFDRFHGFAL